MTWQFTPRVYLMLAAAAISFTVVAFTLRRRQAPASKPLAAVNFVGGYWALTAGLELASSSLGAAFLFHKLSFLGMGAIGPIWWAFAARYVGRDQWASRNKLIALSVVPFVTQVLLWTNQYHGWVFESLSMRLIGGQYYLDKATALWWWIDSVYTYAVLIGGFLVLCQLFLREPGLYRRQIMALVGGLLVPFLADVVYVAGLQGQETVDWAPAFFAWVGVAFYWGFTRYRLLDVTPVAREFVAEHMGDALIVADTEDRTTYVNLAGENLLGMQSKTMVGRPLREVMAHRPGLFELYDRVREGSDGYSQEWKCSSRYYDGKVSALLDGVGRVRGKILVLRDISDRKTAELALEEARRELEDRVVERTAELAAEKEHLAQLNTVATEIARCVTSADVLTTGVRLACGTVGADAGTLWLRSRDGVMSLLRTGNLSHGSWKTLRLMFETSLAKAMAQTNATPLCLRAEPTAGGAFAGAMPATDDTLRTPSYGPDFEKVIAAPLVSRGANLGALCLVSANPAFGDSRETLLLAGAAASQIAVALENARRYEEAQFLAERDSLTRLLNHRGFSRRYEQEIARSTRSGSVTGLIMIDVDNFKLFNDAHGHVVGDRVLQEVSRILTTTLRRSDIVARYGGDEFIVLLPDTDAEAAVLLAERVRKALKDNPFPVEGHRRIPLKMSYGIAIFPYDGATPSELLAAADTNLYRSKRRGGDYITASGGESSRHPVGVGSFSVLDGLVTMVDNKDHYTRRHSEDVTEYSLALAARLGLSVETERSLRVAALLHDVGKLGVPDHILRKPAALSDTEFEAIKNHVTLGELIIQGIPNQEEVIEAVSSHHERIDGKGYPRGLKGTGIPLLGRILAVTDAYSAMTSDRPYRKALSPEEAKAELRHVAGTQLDPHIVDVFLTVLEDSEAADETRVAVYASARA